MTGGGRPGVALGHLGAPGANWPWASTVPATFFAIVDSDDLTIVVDLIALAPEAPGATSVAWFRRFRDGWLADPTIPRRLALRRDQPLRSITPKIARTVEMRLKF